MCSATISPRLRGVETGLHLSPAFMDPSSLAWGGETGLSPALIMNLSPAFYKFLLLNEFASSMLA